MVAKYFYKAIRHLLFRARARGASNIVTEEPVIFVANHAGSFGPVSVITSVPARMHPWVAHEVTEPEAAARRIQAEFFEQELHLKPPLSSSLARLVGRICVALMKDIGAIPVFARSRKIQTTVERSLALLEQGRNILVFPEDAKRPINEVFSDFCTGFIHLARLYYERTRKAILFLPIAVNRNVGAIRIGKPIRYDAEAPYPQEKLRLKRELERTIHTLYYALEEEGSQRKASGMR